MKNRTPSRFSRAMTAALKEYGFTRITGAAATPSRTFETSDVYDQPIGSRAYDRTLPAYKAKNLNATCWDAYKRNPIIWGAVELIVRATAGRQAQLVHNKLGSEDATERAIAEQMQALFDSWWHSPINSWPLLAENIQREKILFGEFVPIFMTSSLTGDVEVGFIDANCIKRLVRNPLNTREIRGITVELDGGKERTLKIISDYAGEPIDPARQEWFDTWAGVPSQRLLDRYIGEVMYWSNNRTVSSQRGQGDFAQVIDAATDAVKVVQGIADRIQLNNRVVSDLTFPDNWTQEQINDALDPTKPETYIAPPRLDDLQDEARVFGHTAGIKHEFKSPQIAASESESVFKMCLALFSSGTNLPLHFLGWADELTYASAKELSNQAISYLRDRQESLRKDLTDATEYQIDQWRIFKTELDSIPEELLFDFSIVLPEVDARTLEQKATIMKSEMDTILAAKQNAAINDETAAGFMQKTMRKGGISE